ncbi:MAG: transposase [Rhodospirillales bacterium]|nr:transposase [Rhodospirillales bacterium]
MRDRRPSEADRQTSHAHDRIACRGRNVVEGMFCRFKDSRRIATRYDKRADTLLSAVLIAATLLWWLN